MRYPRLKRINLTKNYKYSFLKNEVYKSPRFEENGTEVTAERNIMYEKDPDADELTFKNKMINTIRPGVVKAAEAIENRPDR